MVSKIMPNVKIKSQMTNVLIVSTFTFPYVFLISPVLEVGFQLKHSSCTTWFINA